MEKLRKTLDKTQSKMESNSKDKQKNENKLREANSGANQKDGDIKSLNVELQNPLTWSYKTTKRLLNKLRKK